MYEVFESLQHRRTRQVVSIFLCLQILDIISTLMGLRMGASEANYFVAKLLQLGPFTGLVVVKVVACILAAYALRLRRERLLRLVNFWFVAVITWNIVIISSIPTV